jgi:hypothetical protein
MRYERESVEYSNTVGPYATGLFVSGVRGL